MKRVFSGVQPTGNIHIGNYLGALRQFVELQEENECIYCIVDLHSITVPQDPKELRKHILDVAALYLAIGIDPKKSIVFVQSDVSGHAELSWILTCNSYTGELSRMTQFKDKSKGKESAPTGLFTYPILMAADILLYQADVVPVGVDQKQHLELTRDIANRFNGIYGDVFTIPEAYIGESTAKIMSLQDPSKKMSKSDENPNASILLMDDPDTIIRKFKRAVTDSDMEIRYSDEKPGIQNLINIYSCITGKSIEEVEKEFDGKGYGDFKLAVGECVADRLKPLQDRFYEIQKDKAYLNGVIKENDEKAAYFANKTLRKVQKKVGLTERIR